MVEDNFFILKETGFCYPSLVEIKRMIISSVHVVYPTSVPAAWITFLRNKFMGLYIDYYLDSDLINKPPLDVVSELERRLGQKLNCYDHYKDNSQVQGWFLESLYGIITNHAKDKTFHIKYQTKNEHWDILYLKGTFHISEENTQFSCGRYNTWYHQYLIENNEIEIQNTHSLINRIKKIAIPILHSTKLFVYGDDYCNDLFEEGMTIDDFIEKNKISTFSTYERYTDTDARALLEDLSMEIL